jgi:hypothetical protein
VDRAGLRLRDVLEDIESFALLALTYISLHEEDAAGPQSAVPYAALHDPRRCGRKARQVAKKFSLFKVRRVGAPSESFGRTTRENGGSDRKLGRRTEVRGHFRLQACGPRRSQRRLLWIAPHMRGPLDGILSTALVRLESANDGRAGEQAA